MRTVAYLIALMVMCLFGAMDMTRGVAAPFMESDWHLSYLQIGTAFAMNSLGYLAGSFSSGFFVDRFGLKRVILYGGLATVCGIACIAALHSYAALGSGFFVFGAGGGWLEIGVNGVVPAISKSENEQASRFNTLHGLYGFGAFASPVAVAWLIQSSGSWRIVYVVIGIALLGVLTVTAVSRDTVLTAARTPVPAVHQSAAGRGVYADPLLYLLLLGITTYVMAEGALASWLPTYLVEEKHLSAEGGALYLSGFYLTFTIGRLSAHWWVTRVGSYRSILMSAGFALTMLAGAFALPHGLVCFVFAGIGFAVVFPTIASIASHAFAEKSGTVLGFLFTAGGIGSMLVNGLVGYVAVAFGLSIGFGVVLPCMGLVLVSSVAALCQSRVRMKRLAPGEEAL